MNKIKLDNMDLNIEYQYSFDCECGTAYVFTRQPLKVGDTFMCSDCKTEHTVTE